MAVRASVELLVCAQYWGEGLKRPIERIER